MKTIERGYLVSMHYNILMEDGSEIGSTREGEPLTFIPGLMETDPPELGNRILGQPLDFKGQIILSPKEAYGEALPIEQSVGVVSRDSFPPDFPLEPGMIFEIELAGKGFVPGMVLEVFGDEVRLKYGHPLAGQTITFDVEVLEARLATDEDVELLKAKYQG
jgi:FKBP-type peptidyl-prolyl cis-trans isomerase 2